MGTIASLITSLTIVYSTVYSDADQRKHQSSASLAFVWGIHRGPVNSPHKWWVTRKMFPFDDVTMCPKFIWNSNLLKPRLSIAFLFWNFAYLCHYTIVAISLPCSLHHCFALWKFSKRLGNCNGWCGQTSYRAILVWDGYLIIIGPVLAPYCIIFTCLNVHIFSEIQCGAVITRSIF